MASYFSAPNAQQFQFTPSTPPVQEALSALQAKTQYWLSNASQIKSQYDKVLGADYTTDQSKQFVEGFRKEIEPKLRDIAKQDLSIGEIKNTALKLFEPAVRNEGLLIDEETTKLGKSLFAQAKADAGKNGGNYNAYSVEYTSQMLDRYKRENNNTNSDYLSILQSNAYVPYNEKAGNEIKTIAEKFGKEKRKVQVDMGNGLFRETEEPAYSVADLSTIIRENLSPAAQKLYDIQAKVQFNRYQLAAQSPEELHAVGSTIKQQYNSFYDEKIQNLKIGVEEAKQTLAKTATNDINYDKIKKYTDDLVAQGEQQIKVNEEQRDEIKEDYFTDPKKWKLGETYYTDLFINQKIRDDATALVNRQSSVSYKPNTAWLEMEKLSAYRERTNQQALAAKAKSDKDSNIFEPITNNISQTVGEGLSNEQKGSNLMEEARHLKVNEDNKLTTQVLSELGIAGRDKNGELVDFNKFATQFNSETKMKEAIPQMTEEAVKTLTDIFNSTKTDIPKDDKGNILWDNVSVIDVRDKLNAAMQDPEQIKAFIRRAGFENGKIDTISNLYYQNGMKESNKNNLDFQLKPIYEKTLQKYGINVPEDIYNFDTPENLAKSINYEKIEKAVGRPLNPNEKKNIVDYVSGKTEGRDFFDQLQGFDPAITKGLQIAASTSNLPFSEFVGKLIGRNASAIHHLFSGNSDANKIMRAVDGVHVMRVNIDGEKDRIDAAKNELKQQLGNKESITFSAVSSTYHYKPDFAATDDRSHTIDYSGVINLLKSSQGSTGGDNSSGNISKYKTIADGITQLGLTDAIEGVDVVAAGQGEISPYMTINFNSSKIKEALDKKLIPQTDDGSLFRKGDLEKILSGQPVKIYLTDSEEVRKYVKIPDRSAALLSNGKGLTFDTFSGNKIKATNEAINGGSDVTPGITGKAKMITKFDGKTLEIGNVDFSPRNMSNLTKYQGITNETINPSNKTKSFKGLQSAIQYILNEDAKMQIVTEFADKKKVLQVVDGKTIINLEALSQDDRDQLLKIIQDGTI